MLELGAQLAHEDVDRAVAVGHRVAPYALVDLFALEHAALGARQQLDELELAAREVDRAAVGEDLELVRADLDLAGEHRVGAERLTLAAAPRHGLQARDELLRVAWLRHPVVGPHPQPAHAL